MVVPYTHFNYYLIHAYYAIDSIEGNIIFDFKEYVKSQVHYNITKDLFGRDFSLYMKVYENLQSPNVVIDSATMKVLGYFYEDISNIVLQSINSNGVCKFDFKINLPFKGIAKLPVSLEKTKEVFNRYLELIPPPDKSNAIGVDFLRDISVDKRPGLEITNTICKAAYLAYFAKKPIIIDWR